MRDGQAVIIRSKHHPRHSTRPTGRPRVEPGSRVVTICVSLTPGLLEALDLFLGQTPDTPSSKGRRSAFIRGAIKSAMRDALTLERHAPAKPL